SIERELPKQRVLRLGHLADRCGCRVDAKEMHIGLLKRVEVDPGRAPSQGKGALVERRRYDSRGSAVGRHHGHRMVTVGILLLAPKSMIGEQPPIGRPDRTCVGPGSIYDSARRLGVNISYIDVGLPKPRKAGLRTSAKHDAPAIRRPGKLAHCHLWTRGE